MLSSALVTCSEAHETLLRKSYRRCFTSKVGINLMELCSESAAILRSWQNDDQFQSLALFYPPSPAILSSIDLV